ncbi:hypothetical protein FNV43_RR21207 [Rhamnella rubrinervis]|uniref:Uncharacterized protein n=1 Tax=Rhamnella rubrinervis TaxID=2594499 RepID=A0A8K0GXL5_9ROSA|nr:hypothetical protein FNV43_RR21207 [Rhamnella rubrinervis]
MSHLASALVSYLLLFCPHLPAWSGHPPLGPTSLRSDLPRLGPHAPSGFGFNLRPTLPRLVRPPPVSPLTCLVRLAAWSGPPPRLFSTRLRFGPTLLDWSDLKGLVRTSCLVPPLPVVRLLDPPRLVRPSAPGPTPPPALVHLPRLGSPPSRLVRSPPGLVRLSLGLTSASLGPTSASALVRTAWSTSPLVRPPHHLVPPPPLGPTGSGLPPQPGPTSTPRLIPTSPAWSRLAPLGPTSSLHNPTSVAPTSPRWSHSSHGPGPTSPGFGATSPLGPTSPGGPTLHCLVRPSPARSDLPAWSDTLPSGPTSPRLVRPYFWSDLLVIPSRLVQPRPDWSASPLGSPPPAIHSASLVRSLRLVHSPGLVDLLRLLLFRDLLRLGPTFPCVCPTSRFGPTPPRLVHLLPGCPTGPGSLVLPPWLGPTSTLNHLLLLGRTPGPRDLLRWCDCIKLDSRTLLSDLLPVRVPPPAWSDLLSLVPPHPAWSDLLLAWSDLPGILTSSLAPTSSWVWSHLRLVPPPPCWSDALPVWSHLLRLARPPTGLFTSSSCSVRPPPGRPPWHTSRLGSSGWSDSSAWSNLLLAGPTPPHLLGPTSFAWSHLLHALFQLSGWSTGPALVRPPPADSPPTGSGSTSRLLCCSPPSVWSTSSRLGAHPRLFTSLGLVPPPPALARPPPAWSDLLLGLVPLLLLRVWSDCWSGPSPCPDAPFGPTSSGLAPPPTAWSDLPACPPPRLGPTSWWSDLPPAWSNLLRAWSDLPPSLVRPPSLGPTPTLFNSSRLVRPRLAGPTSPLIRPPTAGSPPRLLGPTSFGLVLFPLGGHLRGFVSPPFVPPPPVSSTLSDRFSSPWSGFLPAGRRPPAVRPPPDGPPPTAGPTLLVWSDLLDLVRPPPVSLAPLRVRPPSCLVRPHPGLVRPPPGLVRLHSGLVQLRPGLVRLPPGLVRLHPGLVRLRPGLVRLHPVSRLRPLGPTSSAWSDCPLVAQLLRPCPPSSRWSDLLPGIPPPPPGFDLLLRFGPTHPFAGPPPPGLVRLHPGFVRLPPGLVRLHPRLVRLHPAGPTSSRLVRLIACSTIRSFSDSLFRLHLGVVRLHSGVDQLPSGVFRLCPGLVQLPPGLVRPSISLVRPPPVWYPPSGWVRPPPVVSPLLRLLPRSVLRLVRLCSGLVRLRPELVRLHPGLVRLRPGLFISTIRQHLISFRLVPTSSHGPPSFWASSLFVQLPPRRDPTSLGLSTSSRDWSDSGRSDLLHAAPTSSSLATSSRLVRPSFAWSDFAPLGPTSAVCVTSSCLVRPHPACPTAPAWSDLIRLGPPPPLVRSSAWSGLPSLVRHSSGLVRLPLGLVPLHPSLVRLRPGLVRLHPSLVRLHSGLVRLRPGLVQLHPVGLDWPASTKFIPVRIRTYPAWSDFIRPDRPAWSHIIWAWSDIVLAWSNFTLAWSDFILAWFDFVRAWSDFLRAWTDFVRVPSYFPAGPTSTRSYLSEVWSPPHWVHFQVWSHLIRLVRPPPGLVRLHSDLVRLRPELVRLHPGLVRLVSAWSDLIAWSDLPRMVRLPFIRLVRLRSAYFSDSSGRTTFRLFHFIRAGPLVPTLSGLGPTSSRLDPTFPRLGPTSGLVHPHLRLQSTSLHGGSTIPACASSWFSGFIRFGPTVSAWSDLLRVWCDLLLAWFDFIRAWSDFVLAWSDLIRVWSDLPGRPLIRLVRLRPAWSDSSRLVRLPLGLVPLHPKLVRLAPLGPTSSGGCSLIRLWSTSSSEAGPPPPLVRPPWSTSSLLGATSS